MTIKDLNISKLNNNLINLSFIDKVYDTRIINIQNQINILNTKIISSSCSIEDFNINFNRTYIKSYYLNLQMYI